MHTCDDHHSLAWPLIIIMAVLRMCWLAWRVRRGWPAGAGCLLLLIGARAGAGWCDVALTTKQQAFIEHMVRTWNASQAARDAV